MQTRFNFMRFSHCFNPFLPFPGNGSKMSMGSWPPKISCARICRTWTRSWSPFRSLRFVSTGCGNAPRKSSDTSLNQIAMQILLVEGNYLFARCHHSYSHFIRRFSNSTGPSLNGWSVCEVVNHALTLLSKYMCFHMLSINIGKNPQSCHKLIFSQLDFNEESPFIHHIPLASQIGRSFPLPGPMAWLWQGRGESSCEEVHQWGKDRRQPAAVHASYEIHMSAPRGPVKDVQG